MDGDRTAFLHTLFQCVTVLKRKELYLTCSQNLFSSPLSPPFYANCLSSSHHAPLSTAWLHLASPLLNLSLLINVLPLLGGTKTGPGILDVVLMACSAKYRSILVIFRSDSLTSTAMSLLVFI